jgi:hypothetical protein
MMISRLARALVALLLAVTTVGMVGLAQADGTAPRNDSAVLHTTFRVVFTNCPGALHDLDFASQEFVLFSCGFSRSLLVDDRTEKRVSIKNSSSCGWLEARALGAPSILFFCGHGERVYNIVTRKWRPVPCSNSRCAGPQGAEVVREAVGARWVEYDQQWPGPCTPDYHNTCGPIEPVFVNIRTGGVRRSWPKSPTTILDLDSPTLARRLCTPLRVPAPGSLTMEGQFAVITAGNGSYLQRCGSHRHTVLSSPGGASVSGGGLWANEHAVFWAVESSGGWKGQLAGILLPSLRRFTATIPPRLRSSFVLPGATHMYMPDANGQIWAAPFPPKPRP